MPASGRLKKALTLALHANELKGNRSETERTNARALHKLAAYITERGLNLDADALLEAIKATDKNKRERRAAIQAAGEIADAVEIPLFIPKGLHYQNPPAKKRKLTEAQKIMIRKFLNHGIEEMPHWIAYIYRAVMCTGVRSNAVFSMEIPKGPISPGAPIHYVDSKRSRPNKLVMAITTPHYNKCDESWWNIWQMWNVPDEIKKLQVIGRSPTDEELTKMNRKSQDAQSRLHDRFPQTIDLITYRNLRHLAVESLFKKGIDDYTIASVVSTSAEQLRKTYSQLYTNEATERIGQAFGFTVKSTEADVKRSMQMFGPKE